MKQTCDYRLVDVTSRNVKPYQHSALEWSYTFNQWYFVGEAVERFPYHNTNQIAESLGLEPNAMAMKQICEVTFRAFANEYEWTCYVLAASLDSAIAEGQRRSSNPIVMVKYRELPQLFPGEDYDSFIAGIVADEGVIHWTQEQVKSLESDLHCIASYGLLGQEAIAPAQKACLVSYRNGQRYAVSQ